MLRHDSDMTRSNAGSLGKEEIEILCPPGTSKNIGFRTHQLQGCLEIPLVLGIFLELSGPFLLLVSFLPQ